MYIAEQTRAKPTTAANITTADLSYFWNIKPRWLKRSCFAKMADDRVCLYTTVTMEIKQKINMQLKKLSRTEEHTLKTIIYEENVRFKTIITEKITKPRAISREKNVSWVTRRAVIKLTYFSGFTTAIYRSSAKLHRFIAEAYAKSHLIKSTQDAYGWGQLQPPLM